MSDPRQRVLIVEDEFIIAHALRLKVESMGLNVCGMAATAARAVALAHEHRPSIVLIDERLRGTEDGVDAALAIHKSVSSNMIFITGSQEPSTIARIQLDHPAAVLFKPISDRQLRDAIERTLSG
jgi:AmiR/NasT family two-component response regulator